MVIGSFSMYIYYYYSSYRKDLFISRLTSKAQVIQKLDDGQGSEDEISNALIYNDLLTLFEEKIILINSNNDITYTNILESDVLDKNVQIVKKNSIKNRFRYVHNTEEEIVLYRFESGSILFISAIDILGNDKLNNLKSTLILGNIFALMVSFFLGLIFSEKILKPLYGISKTLNIISDNDLSSRLLIPKNKDEIYLISSYFNKMMDRLQRGFINQKNFISHASHEMRTPLTKVLINLEAFKNRTKPGTKANLDLQLAIADTKVAIDLVNGLLQLAIVSKAEELERTLGRLDEVVLAQLSNVQDKYPDIALNFDLKNMDSEFEPILCYFHKDLFPIAIYNLIENAVKYGGGKPVNISIIKENEYSTVEIKDHGLGILTSDLNFIFEPLYRGRNTTSVKGFGIGLSLVKRIFDLHHLKINIESNLNEGTSIAFSIPPS